MIKFLKNNLLLLILLILIFYFINIKLNKLDNKDNKIIIKNNLPGIYEQQKQFLSKGPSKRYIPDNAMSIEDFKYSQIGFLSRSESDSNYNPDGVNKLALYARKDPDNSRLYQYYVMEDGIKIPLDLNKEIYKDDTVSIPTLTGNFNANIYDTESLLRYNPYINAFIN